MYRRCGRVAPGVGFLENEAKEKVIVWRIRQMALTPPKSRYCDTLQLKNTRENEICGKMKYGCIPCIKPCQTQLPKFTTCTHLPSKSTPHAVFFLCSCMFSPDPYPLWVP
jgi:hypothetical protein